MHSWAPVKSKSIEPEIYLKLAHRPICTRPRAISYCNHAQVLLITKFKPVLSLTPSPLCLLSFRSLEYDPRFYGLFLHDDNQVPSDVSMWDHLDEVAPGYQDSLVMHMIHKPVQVSFQGAEDRWVVPHVM